MTTTTLTARDRVIRTLLQVLGALVVLIPTVASTIGTPANAVGWILAIAAAAVVVVNGLWNVIVSSTPGPHQRVVRTTLQAIVAFCLAVPTAIAAVGEPTSTTAWISGLLAAAVVLISAVQNSLDQRKGR